MITCENCQSFAKELYQRDTDGRFVCLSCVPDSTFNNYPGWREREDLRSKRANQARANFGHKASPQEREQNLEGFGL